MRGRALVKISARLPAVGTLIGTRILFSIASFTKQKRMSMCFSLFDTTEKAMERGDFMSESERQDGDRYSDSDHTGVLRDTSQVQRTTPERRTFRNDQNRKVGFLDQKHHKAPISRRGSDADGTGASQTNQASDSDETKKISTKKVHPSLQKQDLKTKNPMSDMSSSCSHNYSSDFKAPPCIRRSSRQREPTIKGLWCSSHSRPKLACIAGLRDRFTTSPSIVQGCEARTEHEGHSNTLGLLGQRPHSWQTCIQIQIGRQGLHAELWGELHGNMGSHSSSSFRSLSNIDCSYERRQNTAY